MTILLNLKTNPSKNNKCVPKKPKRPLSAYNIFYQLFREYMISLHHRDKTKDIINLTSDYIFSMNNQLLFKLAIEITIKYRCNLPAKGVKAKGVLGFQEITRVIAKKWSHLSESRKMIFNQCSQHDKSLYFREINTWKKEKDAEIKRKLEEQKIIDTCFETPLNSAVDTVDTVETYYQDSSLLRPHHVDKISNKCYEVVDLVSVPSVAITYNSREEIDALRQSLLNEVFECERDLCSFFSMIK